MARKQAEQLDLLNTPILGLVLENLSSDPTVRPQGAMYWNTTADAARISDGSAWADLVSAGASESAASLLAKIVTVDGAGSGLDADTVDGQQAAALLARGNHTGTQASSTISDFTASVEGVLTSFFDTEAATAAYNTWLKVTQEMADDDSEYAALVATVASKAVSGRTSSFGNGALTTFSLANPVGLDAQPRCVNTGTGAVDVEPRIVTTATTFEVTFTNYVPSNNEFEIAYAG